MKRRYSIILVLGLIASLILAACGQTSDNNSGSAKKITVGLVQIDLSNPFHLAEVEGAKEAARRFGFNLKVTSGEGDVSKQVQAFENLINQHVDVIPSTSSTFMP